MLVELKQVEVFVEPNDILTQAIQEGDLTVDYIVRECISEESVEVVLDAVDNDDILDYVESHNLDVESISYSQVSRTINEFSETDRAKILWQLLKCQEV